MTRLIVLLALAACGVNAPRIHSIEPDGGIDAACHPSDAAADPCCAYAPDVDAVRACEQPTFPANSCGVVVCQLPACGRLLVNVCGPS